MISFFKKVYIIWCFIAAIISLFLLLFEGSKLYNYFTNDFVESSMKINKIDFYSSSGRRDVADIDGTINGNKVYFSLYDEEIRFIKEYLEEISDQVLKQVGYEELSNIDFFVPVIKFRNSNNVILIGKNNTKTETFKEWIKPKIILFLIAYVPLVMFLILKRIYENN